ncbi:hypothetical protein BDV93DRAFT_528670 [Ceratobasidium sp. AG-I]|nr:hypothetical protein BDV93DRAFT_528670 [Ceratobasidium sp. AG-I]
MEDTIIRPPPRYLPHEIISLIASKTNSLRELSLFSLVSRAFYSEAVAFLYTHVEFASAAQSSKPKWIREISLWARTITYNRNLAHHVETLILHLPECDLPVLYRRTLAALRHCINLRELEIYQPSHLTLSYWLIPAITPLALIKFATDLQASDSLARVLESQPSIRTLRLETFDMQMRLELGSLPNLAHYTGFTRLISAARTSGATWDNLIHAELHDAYRWELGLLDSMPRLRMLDITVAAGAADLLARIAEKCQELRSLTLRDSNGIMHDRRELADGRLAGIALLPDFAASFGLLKHLSSLTIDPIYPLRQCAQAHTDRAQLVLWHSYCPTLRQFTSPTRRKWLLGPANLSFSPSSSGPSLARPLPNLGLWSVIFEPIPTENVFATDPGVFGMRRAGSVRERSEAGNVDELIAIIERLNHERANV